MRERGGREKILVDFELAGERNVKIIIMIESLIKYRQVRERVCLREQRRFS